MICFVANLIPHRTYPYLTEHNLAKECTKGILNNPVCDYTCVQSSLKVQSFASATFLFVKKCMIFLCLGRAGEGVAGQICAKSDQHGFCSYS